MAQAWSSLGSRVTVVHRGDRLIEREERFASEQVLAALREGGVDVRLGTSVTSVSRNGAVHVEVDDGAPFDADEILVSIGRAPRTHDIGLETVGLEAGGYIRTDESLRVDDRDWLYAIGDVNGRALLTHMGKYQGRLAADAIMGKDVRLRSDGRVAAGDLHRPAGRGGGAHACGRGGGRAPGAGRRRRDGRQRRRLVRRAWRPGTARIVVDEDRRVVVGATITGAEVAEALHAATIAVVAEVPLDDLWHAVPSFPTRSIWLRLLESYGL